MAEEAAFVILKHSHNPECPDSTSSALGLPNACTGGVVERPRFVTSGTGRRTLGLRVRRPDVYAHRTWPIAVVDFEAGSVVYLC
jgi:hypothetical protein